jgi:hypothetical protein
MPLDDLPQHDPAMETAGAACARMNVALAAFDDIGLGADERLAAVASAIAAAAMKRHAAAALRFLRFLQELTRPGAGGLVRTGSPGHPRAERIAEGAALLDGAFDRLSATLAEAAMPRAEAHLVEAVLLARLLAEFRPLAVRLALVAVERAIADPGYRCGTVVAVPAAAPPAAVRAAG